MIINSTRVASHSNLIVLFIRTNNFIYFFLLLYCFFYGYSLFINHWNKRLSERIYANIEDFYSKAPPSGPGAGGGGAEAEQLHAQGPEQETEVT